MAHHFHLSPRPSADSQVLGDLPYDQALLDHLDKSSHMTFSRQAHDDPRQRFAVPCGIGSAHKGSTLGGLLGVVGVLDDAAVFEQDTLGDLTPDRGLAQ